MQRRSYSVVESYITLHIWWYLFCCCFTQMLWSKYQKRSRRWVFSQWRHCLYYWTVTTTMPVCTLGQHWAVSKTVSIAVSYMFRYPPLYHYGLSWNENKNSLSERLPYFPVQEATLGCFQNVEEMIAEVRSVEMCRFVDIICFPYCAGVFRECGGARCAHNMVPYPVCRHQALGIVQQLVLSNGGDDDMRTLLGLMHTAPTAALELKTHILKVDWNWPQLYINLLKHLLKLTL